MMDLLPAITSFFAKQRHWDTAPCESPRGVEVRHTRSTAPYVSHAHQLPGRDVLVYDSLCPVSAAAEHRPAVAHFIARVNSALVVGALSLDWASGVVRCRTAIDLRGQPLTDALIEGVVVPNHQVMIDYLDHLLSVMRGEQDPDDAFAEATEQLEPPPPQNPVSG
jgi:hypothetical protein